MTLMFGHHSDIPDVVFLQAVKDTTQPAGQPRAGTTTRWAVGEQVRNSQAQDTAPIPEAVILAKVTAMKKRGFMNGCTCSCPGNLKLTDTGRAYLSRHNLAALKALVLTPVDGTP